jgi:hypothetical protein
MHPQTTLFITFFYTMCFQYTGRYIGTTGTDKHVAAELVTKPREPWSTPPLLFNVYKTMKITNRQVKDRLYSNPGKPGLSISGCVDKVWVEAVGPFGKTEGRWFDNGVGAYARLDLAKSDFPAGYQYKIGIGAGSPDESVPSQLTWFIETSTGGWQYYSYVYNNDNGTELLYTMTAPK